jgi:uncharacterized membrane protein YphA (DoxX/SURF4 family)
MRRRLRIIVLLFFAALVAVPLSAVTVVALFPFWSWFEARTGVESIGHSGPAGWCFILMYVLLTILGWLAILRKESRPIRSPE